MTIIYANSRLKATVLTLALSSANVFAETDSNSMESYTTCAVYHRMLAGAYMRESQSPELANLETQKMHVFIANAKRVGPQALSAEAIEQLFLKAWRADLQRMETQIRGNYKNIRRLRLEYKKTCANLHNMQAS